jgi:cytochrome c peroxidase
MFVRWTVYLLALFVCYSPSAAEAESGVIKPDMTQLVLGKLIFEDPQLSSPRGQSCASCHQSEQAFADPGKAVSPGANPMLFGNRNAPSIAYVKFNPELFWNKEESLWMGGFFHDGRAKTLQEQAGGPFLNPLEMGNKTMAELVVKVKAAAYAPLFEQYYGHDIWSNVDNAFAAITAAIVVYEKGPEFASFDSKYDLYLQGKVHLSAQEKEGLVLFEAEDKGNCAACHPSQVSTENPRPLFTDYSYDNLGQPANKTLNFYQQSALYNPDGDEYIDFGLANNPHIDNADEEKGKIKVPSLRNIAKTAPYFHNGGFTSLKEVVEFYNERDVDIKNSLANRRWANAEVNENINDEELGDLKLSADEVDAIVAFMKTLTDGYQMTKVAAEH